MADDKTRVFIAASVEGLNIAYAIQESLEYSAEVTVWSQGVFDISEYTLDELEKELDKFDFGVFVFAFEDLSIMRDSVVKTTRDNIIFELGLFVGRIGRKRCYMVMPKSTDKMHLPTDLLGIKPALYNPNRSDGNLQAALGPACNKIRRLISKYGKRGQNKISISTDVLKQINDAGISAFYQSRDDYGKYKRDVSSISRYVSTAQKSIHMVSINLMTGLPFDDLCSVFKEKLEKFSDSFMVTVSLLNPNSKNLMESLSPVLSFSPDKLAKSIEDSLEELNKLKESLPLDLKNRFKILVHNAIPFGSAIMLDVFSKNGRIQIETKPYKVPLRKSFGFEVTNNGSNDIYSTLRDGYCQLLDEADSYDNFIRSDGGAL